MNYQKLCWFSLLLNLLGLVAAILLIYRLGGWNYVMYRLNNRGITAEYDHRKSMYEHLPEDTATIVLLGNSLTAQGNWSELLQEPKIRNRGIPGDQTAGVLRRLLAVSHLQPVQIFLMIGVNDLLFRSPPEILENYRRLVDSIQMVMPDSELLLQSVLPVNNEVRYTQVKNKDISVLNEGIEQLAQEYGLSWIDIRPAVSDEAGRLRADFTQDGVHLNGPAYMKWAEVLQPYIKTD